MSKYKVDSTSLTAVANAIRAKTGSNAGLSFPTEFVSAIGNIPSSSSEWTRPSEWMPYASDFNGTTFEGMYFVYDLADANEYPNFWIVKFSKTSGGSVDVKQGYVNSSGTFIEEASETISQNVTRAGALPTWDGETAYQRFYVIKVVPTNCHLNYVILTSLPNANAAEIYGTGASAQNGTQYAQPLMEVYGRLPYADDMSGAFRNRYLIHAKLLDFDSITKANDMFRDCIQLERIDGLDTWDTSHLTQASYFVGYCRKLKKITGIEGWNVSAVTTMQYMLAYTGLEGEIDLSKWRFSSSFTNCGYFFRESYFLTKIYAPGGNYNNATVTDMFRDCKLLKTVVLPQNFSGTSHSYLFFGCNSLSDVNLSNLDTSYSTIMNSMFNSCHLLREVNFARKDISGITTMKTMMDACQSIECLDFTGCDFSAVTSDGVDNIMFRYLWSLQRLKGFAFAQSFGLNYSTLLSETALVEILTNLETVTSATITLGDTLKNKLTDAEKAIATQKGWTIA